MNFKMKGEKKEKVDENFYENSNEWLRWKKLWKRLYSVRMYEVRLFLIYIPICNNFQCGLPNLMKKKKNFNLIS